MKTHHVTDHSFSGPFRDANWAGEQQSMCRLAQGRPVIGVALPSRVEREISPEEANLVSFHFDGITPENAMKWPFISPQKDIREYGPMDEMLTKARSDGKRVHGHTLLFCRAGYYPSWLTRDGRMRASADLVWKRIEGHVVQLMERYRGDIDSWDVLNEFVMTEKPGYRPNALTRILGGSFPSSLFQLAHEVDPRAKLAYNDYGLEEPVRRKVVLSFIRSLQDKGCRVDVVGSQSHLEIDHKDIAADVDATVRDFRSIGVKVAFSELDVDVLPRSGFWNPRTRLQTSRWNPYTHGCPQDLLERQAGIYADFFSAVMENRGQIDRVTFWGLSDRNTWLNDWPWRRVNHPLLFDREWKPKPALHAILKILAKHAS